MEPWTSFQYSTGQTCPDAVTGLDRLQTNHGLYSCRCCSARLSSGIDTTPRSVECVGEPFNWDKIGRNSSSNEEGKFERPPCDDCYWYNHKWIWLAEKKPLPGRRFTSSLACLVSRCFPMPSFSLLVVLQLRSSLWICYRRFENVIGAVRMLFQVKA